MANARNIALIAIATFALSSTMANVALGASLSSTQLPTRTYLEGRSYQEFPWFDAEAFSDKGYQTNFEQAVADAAPHRDRILEANARIHSCVISISNLIFGFPAYHTFFGSDIAYCASANAVLEQPAKSTSWRRNHFRETIGDIRDLIEKNAAIEWQFALVDRAATTEASPTHGLVNEPLDYEWYYSASSDGLSEVCDLPDLRYTDFQSWLDDYFHTDHHWQAVGAYKAYRTICAGFEIDPTLANGEQTVFKGPFYGAEARSGIIDLASDSIVDVKYNHSNLTIKINGEYEKGGHLDIAQVDELDQTLIYDKYADYYDLCFHDNTALIELFNDDAPKQGLLIIGDSFTNCMERFFAENYRNVYCVDLRRYKGSLQNLIDERPDIEDAVFIVSSTSFYNDSFVKGLKS